MESDAGNEFVIEIENVVKDVSLSRSGRELNEDGLVMIDCGASVIVCPKWFGESTLQKSDGSVQLRGADGRTNTPRVRKASNLAEDLKQPETVRLPCGGGDEADPECQLSVRERKRNTPREKSFSEVRR